MSEALELIRGCEKSGVKVSVSGQNLKIDAPVNLPNSVKDALRRHKADIIRTLTQRPPTIVGRLNTMISAGASFDVSADGFQIFGAENLTETEKQFLTVNQPFVLCTLQQALLMKYLPIDLIPDFIFEIKERAAIAEDGADLTDTPFEIVRDITREWFADLLLQNASQSYALSAQDFSLFPLKSM